MLQDMKDKDAKRVEDGTKSYKKSHDMSESVRVCQSLSESGPYQRTPLGNLHLSASLCISLHLSLNLFASLYVEEETEKKQKSRTEHGIGKFTVPRNLNTATWQTWQTWKHSGDMRSPKKTACQVSRSWILPAQSRQI